MKTIKEFLEKLYKKIKPKKNEGLYGNTKELEEYLISVYGKDELDRLFNEYKKK